MHHTRRHRYIRYGRNEPQSWWYTPQWKRFVLAFAGWRQNEIVILHRQKQ
jgi:hypothetical protein